ncbi:MAG: hypothetical protein IPM18_10570 [Phycisphaerales bacterium]|nr:hypothetical protein [Phycisphaerales bacterium]
MGPLLRDNIAAVVLVVMLVPAGCRRAVDNASGGAQAGNAPVLTLISPEALKWTRDEAVAALPDPATMLSAAVRLVQLAELDTLLVPGTLDDQHVRRLSAVRLFEERWVLGLLSRSADDVLRAAVLIDADGTVQPIALGPAEELLQFHLAPDPDIFPHVAVLPEYVLIVPAKGEVIEAIVLESGAPAHFALQRRGRVRYMALQVESREVARYRWDAWEQMFLGPARDKLPDPPGGEFNIDLELSHALVPVGGIVPERQDNTPQHDADEEDEEPGAPAPRQPFGPV